jgi:hypothetical protein
MDFFLIIKLAVVFGFLIMFLRGARLFWGIGLLAVTTAVLLDTFLNIFGREEMLANIGSFIYIINGALFMGGLFWLWGLLRPALRQTAVEPVGSGQPVFAPPARPVKERPIKERVQNVETAFDRQMLYEQMRHRLGANDLRNVIFDLGINENDIIGLNQDANSMILNLMDMAEERGQGGQLALAVERILAPLPTENLPRLEKINEDSPRTVLRHYLLAHYTLADLMILAAQLGIAWDDLGGDNREAKTRELLLFLIRRNRLSELIDLLHGQSEEE